MQRALLALLVAFCSSAAFADGATPSGGYTTLAPQETATRTISAPQYFFVPSLLSSNCCCDGQVTFIPGVVLITPSITTQSWGTNG